MAKPTEPSPLDEAQALLIQLVATGAAPDQITREVGAMIAGWASEPDMAGSTAQARVEQMWDRFTRDAAELQEQIGDADGAGAQAVELARRQLAGLRAVVAALEAVHARLPGAEDDRM